jgi:hypothetical protein
MTTVSEGERCPGRRYVSGTLGTVCIPQECMSCGRIEDIDAEGLRWIAPQDEPCPNFAASIGKSQSNGRSE